MSPKISVIVPVYKAEKYLCRCVDSILSQTFTDFEVLLIDDGSPDKSGEICDGYAKKDSRVRVFHKENGGVSSARNLGIVEAKGEWIYFSDADDELFEYTLNEFHLRMNSNVDCVNGGYIIVRENDVSRNGERPIKNVLWDYKTALLDFYRPNFKRFNGYLWNRIFRKSIIDIYNLRFHEDIFFKEDGLFFVEFICKSQKKVSVTTLPLYKYYINPESAMSSLEIYFNKKYLTNMDARILCWQAVREVTNKNDYALRFQSKKCIVDLYYTILYYIKKHNVHDSTIEEEMKRQMMEYNSVAFVYYCRIYNFYLRTRGRVAKLIRKFINI